MSIRIRAICATCLLIFYMAAVNDCLPESKNPRRQGLYEKIGSFLLSRTKMSSIIGEEALNFRVRNGVGCIHFSVTAIFLAPFSRIIY